MALQQVGLQWVNEGLNTFINDVGKGNSAMHGIGDAAESSGPKISALSGIVMGVASSITTHLINAVEGVIGSVVNLGQESLSMATDFESSATRLKIAGTGAAAQAGISLDQLGEAALAVGGDTRLLGVSAVGASEALTELLKAGIPLNDVMGDFNGYMEEGAELGGVLRGAIDLAAATELDMVEASGLASKSMTIFGFSADEVTEKLDYMVRGADASVADVSNLRDAIEGAGPTLRGFGFTLEDSVDALSLLSNAGIEGAEAGTALRSAWTQMTSDKEKVVSALEETGVKLTDVTTGEFLSFAEILAQLEAATNDMTEAQKAEYLQTIAGAYGKTALTALIDQGTEGYLEYAAALESAAGIEQQSAENSKTLASAQEALEGNLETLKIRIGTGLIPVMNNMVSVSSLVVDKFGPTLTAIFETFGDVLTRVTNYVVGFVDTGDYLNDFFVDLPAPIQNIITKVTEFANTVQEKGPEIQAVIDTVFGFISNTFGAVAETIGEVVVPMFTEAFGDLQGLDWETIGTMIGNLGKVIGVVFVGALSIVTGVISGIAAIISEGIAQFKQFIDGMGEVFDLLAEGDILGALDTFKDVMIDTMTAPFKIIFKGLGGFFKGVFKFFTNFDKDLEKKIKDVQKWVVSKVDEIFTDIKDMVSGAFDDLKNAFEDFKDDVVKVWDDMWDTVETALNNAADAIQSTIDGWIDDIEKAWNDFTSNIEKVWDDTLDAIKTFFSETTDNIETILNSFITTVETAWTTFTEGLKEKWNTFITDIQERWTEFTTNVQESWDTLWTNITEGLTEHFYNIVEAVSTGISDILDTISGYADTFLEKGKEIVEWIRDGIVAGWTVVTTAISDKIKAIGETISGLWETIKGFGHDLVTGIREGLIELWSSDSGVVGGIRTKINNLKADLSATWTKVKEIGEEIVDKIEAGVRDTWNNLVSFITGAFDGSSGVKGLIGAVEKAAEGVRNAGKIIVEYIKKGIQDNWDNFINWLKDLISGWFGGSEPRNPRSPFRSSNLKPKGQWIGNEMVNSIIGGLDTALPNFVQALSAISSAGQMVAPPILSTTNAQTINQQRITNVEVNAAYANYQSETDIRFDVEAALAGAML